MAHCACADRDGQKGDLFLTQPCGTRQMASWSLSSAFLYLLLLLLLCYGGHARTSTFYIMGLFPTESSDPRVRNTFGIYPRAAARYAEERINRLGVLDAHNVTLNLTVFNSVCRGPAPGAHGLTLVVSFAKKWGVHDTSEAGGEKSSLSLCF